MKLIIQIPCLDEEANPPGDRWPDLPRQVPGFDTPSEWLIVDDGSTDANRAGRTRSRRRPRRPASRTTRVLGAAFQAGLDPAVASSFGADVIVNTDHADNQYYGGDHPQGSSRRSSPGDRPNMVVGDREVIGDRALLAA